MRFLRRASAVALALLMLLTAASAQTRSRPRNTVDCTAPSLSLASNATIIRLVSCPEGQTGSCTPNTSQPVQLTATASDANPATLRYKYTTSGGRIAGTGPNVTWDLSNVRPGTYRTTVEVDNDCGCVAFATTTVVVAPCPCAPPPCPTITVDCPTSVVEAGSPVTVTANVSGGAVGLSPSYNWSVTDGRITAGQGTTAITIDTTGLGGRTLTATLDVAGVPPNCQRAVSCAVSAGIKPEPRKFDEIGDVTFNDEKARLDNFAIQLQNEPDAQGYIIVYGGRRSRRGAAQDRANRAKNYLVNSRGLDPGRITTLTPGYREDLTIELWIAPAGAPVPPIRTTVQPGEVQTAPGREGRPRRR